MHGIFLHFKFYQAALHHLFDGHHVVFDLSSVERDPANVNAFGIEIADAYLQFPAV